MKKKVPPSAKTRRSRRFNRREQTREDESLTDTNNDFVLNASKVPLTEVETSLLSMCLRLRLKEQFSQKDPSKDDHADDSPPPPLHNLEEQRIFRPICT